MLIITPLLATALTALLVKLALAVVKIRRRERVSLGDNDIPELQEATRALGNLTEYAPIMLVLIACLEFNAFPIALTALVAIAFFAGRVLHAIGIREAGNTIKKRVLGMQLTLYSLLTAGALNVVWLGYRALT